MLLLELSDTLIEGRNLLSDILGLPEILDRQCDDCENPERNCSNLGLKKDFFFFKRFNLFLDAFLFFYNLFSNLLVIIEKNLGLVLINITRVRKNLTGHNFDVLVRVCVFSLVIDPVEFLQHYIDAVCVH